MIGPLVPHVSRGDIVEFGVHQRDQTFQGLRGTGLELAQQGRERMGTRTCIRGFQ